MEQEAQTELITYKEMTTKHVALWGNARVINRFVGAEHMVFRLLYLDWPDRFVIERYDHGEDYVSDVFRDVTAAHEAWAQITTAGRM